MIGTRLDDLEDCDVSPLHAHSSVLPVLSLLQGALERACEGAPAVASCSRPAAALLSVD